MRVVVLDVIPLANVLAKVCHVERTVWYKARINSKAIVFHRPQF